MDGMPARPDVVRDKLTKAGVDYHTLAKALGVAESTAHMILSGERGIPRKHLPAIAVLLQTSESELLAQNDAPWHGDRVRSAVSTAKGESSVYSHVQSARAAELQAAGRLIAIASEFRQEARKLDQRAQQIARRHATSVSALRSGRPLGDRRTRKGRPR